MSSAVSFWRSCAAVDRSLLNPSLESVDMAHMTDGTDKRMRRPIAANIFCRACGSPLVQAADWEQEEESHWSMRLWCPECGFEQAATLDRPQLLYLSLAIEEGFGWMLRALSELNAISPLPSDLDFAHRAQTDRIRPVGR